MENGGGALRLPAPSLLCLFSCVPLLAACGVLPQDTGSADTGPRSPVVASDTSAQPDAFTVGLSLPLEADGFGAGEARLAFLAAGAAVCSWVGATQGNLELTVVSSDCPDPPSTWSTRLRVVEGRAELAVHVWPSSEVWVAVGTSQLSDGVLVVEPLYALDLQALYPPG